MRRQAGRHPAGVGCARRQAGGVRMQAKRQAGGKGGRAGKQAGGRGEQISAQGAETCRTGGEGGLFYQAA